MKKFYAFFAAALISVSAFASKDVVPSDAVLADYYNQGDVCVCFFVPADMNCNDIVVTGSFNGWSNDLTKCAKTKAVEGYDGWYVASFEPEAEPDASKGMQAKPIMLGGGGEFNWEYQIGAATAIRGGVQVVQGGYAGEIDLINYGADAPNVFTVDAWKQNPCTAIYHNYVITVISDGCEGLVAPYVIGAFTNWDFAQMTYDQAQSAAMQADVYTYSVKAAEGSPYQIVSGLWDAETGEIAVAPAWTDDAYLQKYVDEAWVRYPGEDGDNTLLHEEANILYDVRAEDLRWARCAPAEPAEYTVIDILLPTENAPASVEIIGTFDEWQGTAMEWVTPEGGIPHWFVELEAKASQYFKFRSAGSWDQELEVYNAEDDTWSTIGDNQLVFGKLWEESSYKGTPCKWFELDLRDARWTVKEEGIENVVLTEKAKKVIVDGVIYIIRDNKMFNIHGAQVR